MTVSAQQLTRVFKIGATELPDPAPDEKPEAALRYHEIAYPVLKSCALAEGIVEGERLVFEVIKPQGKTKG